MQAVALAWVASVNSPHVHYSVLVFPFVLAGFGLGMTLAPMATVVLSSTPEADHGKASGVNNTLRELGVALGVAVLTAVFAAKGDYQSPQGFVDGVKPAIWVGAIVVAIGAVIALGLPGPEPATSQATAEETAVGQEVDSPT
jgi:MFS family permease